MPERAAKRLLQPVSLLLDWGLITAFRLATAAARALHLLPQPSPSSTKQQFLIVHPTSFIGDAIMLLPMIEHLRRQHPDAKIDLAIAASIAPLFQSIPQLDKVYGLRLRAPLPSSKRMVLERITDLIRSYRSQMKAISPNVCIMPRWGDDLFCGHFLGYLAGAPRRIGFAATQAPTARNALLTERYIAVDAEHESQRFCRLLLQAGLLPPAAVDLCLSPVDSLRSVARQSDWGALSARLGINADAVFAVIAPGASQPNRRWPADRWAEVIAHLRGKGLEIVLLSGPKDADVALEIHQLASESSVLVAGTTTLQESVTLLSHARLFLGNDSGPGHAAGALGIPTVTLFIDDRTGDPDGASSPSRIHPLGPYLAACLPPRCLPPCSGCCSATYSHCIEQISAEQVISAAETLLDPSGS